MSEKREQDKNSQSELFKYLQWCEEERVIPNLKGYEPFQLLIEEGRIMPYITSIRRMQVASRDPIYYINEDGLLFEIEDPKENPTLLNPKELLSEENSPNGWEPNYLKREEFKDPKEFLI